MSDYEMTSIVCNQRKPPTGDAKYIEVTSVVTSEIVTKRTIDNITYTIRARSSDTAIQTLKEKIDASIARDIARIT